MGLHLHFRSGRFCLPLLKKTVVTQLGRLHDLDNGDLIAKGLRETRNQ
jgi:hypothetical protein